MVVELVCGTHLHAEVILVPAHVSVDIIARHRRHGHAQWGELAVELARYTGEAVGDGAHDGFEGAEALVEFTFSAATRHREIELYAPVAFVVCCLQRGDEGSLGHAFKLLYVLAVVFYAEFEEWTLRRDGAGLIGVLPVETYMESFAKEDDTGRVGVDSVEADGSIAGGVAKEIYTLVGVGQYAASEHES